MFTYQNFHQALSGQLAQGLGNRLWIAPTSSSESFASLFLSKNLNNLMFLSLP